MSVGESAGLGPDKRATSSVPTTATGSIPLSWARPAEDVTHDVEKGGASAGVFVVGFLVVVVVAGLLFSQLIVPLRGRAPAPAPTVTTALPTTPPPPPRPIQAPIEAPKPIDEAPEPATPNPAIAPEDDDAVAGAEKKAAEPTTEAQKKRAQAILRAARLAARDGDDAKAAALAEDAVDKDPRCFECWSTLAFLRGKLGDADGQRAAKMQARALAPKP